MKKILKKFITISLALLLAGSVNFKLYAQLNTSDTKYAVVNVNRASFRSGAGTQYKLIQKITKDEKVQIVNYRGSWLKVKYKDKLGYVYYLYLIIMGEKTTTANSLALRSGPSTSNKKICTISKNPKVYLISQKQGWSRVYYEGKIGYVKGKYLKGKIRICIDAGHQTVGDMKNTEPIAPGSSIRKARVTDGTQGTYTKIPEYKLNLNASKQLKEILKSREYDVIVVRDINNVDMSNVQRAKFANINQADAVIRLHGDGQDNHSYNGAEVLVPDDTEYTKAIYEDSYRLGEYMRDELKSAGVTMFGREIFKRDDLTGFNWSKIPTVLLEMGYMSNETDDYNLAKASYREKLMNCVANSLDDYFK